MPGELITYGADRRMVLSNGEAIRAPIYLDDWSVIRIGLRGAFSGVSANITGTPRIVFGVCNGETNGYGAALSDHVVGIRNNLATVVFTGGSPNYINPFSNNQVHYFKKVGAAVTTTTPSGPLGLFSADTAVRSYVGLQITKGSPNFTLQYVALNTTPELAIDVTDALFQQYMESGTLLPPGGYSLGTSLTLAVSEGADGVLITFLCTGIEHPSNSDSTSSTGRFHKPKGHLCQRQLNPPISARQSLQRRHLYVTASRLSS